MINGDMGLRDAKPLVVIEVWQQLSTHALKLTKLEKQQQQIKCQGEIKSNAEEKYAQQQKLHTYFANEHKQQTLTIAATTTNVPQRSKRKSYKTSMHKALKCLKKCLTTLCFICLFVSKITPTTIKTTTTTTTTTTTSTSAVTATILSLTSVLLHVPFIAASSLRTKSEQQQQQQEVAENMENKNYDIYFARPWTESLLGVEVEVETFTVQDSSALDVVVNDMEEAQSTSNEQQLLAYYARAQKEQAQKYIENQQRSSAYDFDESVTKRAAATKRSVATLATIVSTPMNLTMDMPTVATNITTTTEFSHLYKNLESLSSVIGDGELTVQESTLLDDKCEPKVLNTVPMEPVS